jgi:hypothetical protein
MGLFDENIKNGPKITAQAIRDFQEALTINADDSIEVVCDKVTKYIFYWVHTQLLEYKSFNVSADIILGKDSAGGYLYHYNVGGDREYPPRIEEFIKEMNKRGFIVDVNYFNGDIKICW